MYRKKRKSDPSNMDAQQPRTSSKTFRTPTINLANEKSSKMSESSTSISENGKRKSIFDDVDLSDLKLDNSFKSFSFSSVLMNNSKMEKSNIDDTKSIIESNDLDDIDLDDDILSSSTLSKVEVNTNNNNNNKFETNLTKADTDAMIRLVKNSLIKSPCINKQQKISKSSLSIANIKDDDYDHLLDDDLDFDFDDDLDDNDLNDLIINCQQTQQQSKQQQKNEKFEFRNANGMMLEKPSDKYYHKTKLLFHDIEYLMLQEIACFIYNNNNDYHNDNEHT